MDATIFVLSQSQLEPTLAERETKIIKEKKPNEVHLRIWYFVGVVKPKLDFD